MFNLSSLNPTIQTDSYSFTDTYNESRKYSLSSSEFDSLSQLYENDLNNIKYVQIGQKNVRKNLNNVSDFATFRVNKTTSNGNIVLNGVSKTQRVNKNYWTGFKGGEYDIEMQLIYTPILAASTINRQYRLDKSNSKLIIKELRPNIAKPGSSPQLRNSVYLPYLSFITTNNVNGNHNNQSSGSTFTTSPSPTTPSRPTSPSNPTTTHPRIEKIIFNTSNWRTRNESMRRYVNNTSGINQYENFVNKWLNSYNIVNPASSYSLEDLKSFSQLKFKTNVNQNHFDYERSMVLEHVQNTNTYTISLGRQGIKKVFYNKDDFVVDFRLEFSKRSDNRWELRHKTLTINNDKDRFNNTNKPQYSNFKIIEVELLQSSADRINSTPSDNLGDDWLDKFGSI